MFVLLSFAAVSASGQYSGVTGGGQPVDNYQPTLALRYVICTNGVFPDRENNGSIYPQDRSQPFVGEIRAIPYSASVPAKFVECDGRALSVSGNNALLATIGIVYGGNAVQTVCVPDLRGRVPIGAGPMPGGEYYDLGSVYGADSITLTTDNLPAHVHTLTNGISGSVGSGQSFNNMQPALAINFLIAGDGQIIMFAGNFAPYGTALCNGALLDISSHLDLFGYIGTQYGGDGEQTFALPDLRGRTVIGSGQGAGLSNYTMGDVVGVASTTLTTNLMPAHVHTFANGVTGSTGLGNSFNNRQPSLAMNWFVCISGNSPTNPVSPWIGELRLTAGVSPLGDSWTTSYGQVLPINTFSSLFNLLGVTYGGNGTTTFRLPDIRGRATVSSGQGPGLRSFVIGETAGTENTTLVTSQMAPHAHTVPYVTIGCPSDTFRIADSSCTVSVSLEAYATGVPTPVVTYKLGTNVIASPYDFPIGTNTVTVTASNGIVPDAVCTFKVTVVDIQKPTIVCPSPITVTSDGGYCPKVVTFSPTVNDCALANSYTVPASGIAFPVGTNVVTTYAVDTSGNSNSCSFTVTVLPGPAPTLNLTRIGTNVVFSWPTVFSCYSLEAADALNTNNWTPVGGIPGLNGANYYLTNAAPTTNRFYRLKY